MAVYIAIGILIIFLALGAMQWQIDNHDYKIREFQCQFVNTPQGYRKATDYEFYSCIGK